MNREEKEYIKKQFFELFAKLKKEPETAHDLLLKTEQQIAVHAIGFENNYGPKKLLFPLDTLSLEENSTEDISTISKLEYQSLIPIIEQLRKSGRNKASLSTEDLLNLHFQLFRRTHYNTAGKFRRTNTSITSLNNGQSYHTILNEQCSQHLKWLDDRLNLLDNASPGNFFEIFYIASEIHLRIKHANPFEIGSTIFAILLYNYVHYYTGLIPNIICFEDNSEYHDCLQNSSMADFSKLINFFIASYARTISFYQSHLSVP